MGDVRAFYAWFAEFYAQVYPWRAPGLIRRWEDLAPQFERHGVRCVLDVGCGVGRDVLELARRGCDVAGVDASPDMIRVAERRAAEESLHAAFSVCDATALGAQFEPGSFDAVMCLGNGLPHAATHDEAAAWARSMAALVRPGGLLLLQCQTVDHLTPGDAAPRTEVVGVVRGEPETQILLRRTVFDWPAERIDKTFTRILLGPDACRADERTTRMLMLRRAQIDAFLAATGLRTERLFDGMRLGPYTPGRSDGLLLLATPAVKYTVTK